MRTDASISKGVVHLDPDSLIGKGGERLCFIYPDDENKVVKVLKETSGIYKFPTYESLIRNDNVIDFLYYSFISENLTDHSHIVKCHGWVLTNFGTGLVVDRVVNFDGSTPLNMREAVVAGLVDKPTAMKLLKEVARYLVENKIVFADAKLKNMLLVRTDKHNFHLTIVDGLGVRKLDLKGWFHTSMPLVRYFRVRSQARKLFKEYIKLLRYIKRYK